MSYYQNWLSKTTNIIIIMKIRSEAKSRNECEQQKRQMNKAENRDGDWNLQLYRFYGSYVILEVI